MKRHTIRRSELPEHGVLTFERDGAHYVIADTGDDVIGFAVDGPAVLDLDRAVVADNRLRCPRHGWGIDPVAGRCGASDRCRYEPLAIEVDGDEIRVVLDAV